MAKRVVNYLVDDFDGSEPAETVSFGFKGVEYEIDLAARNVRGFEDDMKRYIAAARRVQPRGRRRRSAQRQRHQELQAARVWLRENGYDIGDRGRIPTEWMDKFEAAGGAAAMNTQSRSTH